MEKILIDMKPNFIAVNLCVIPSSTDISIDISNARALEWIDRIRLNFYVNPPRSIPCSRFSLRGNRFVAADPYYSEETSIYKDGHIDYACKYTRLNSENTHITLPSKRLADQIRQAICLAGTIITRYDYVGGVKVIATFASSGPTWFGNNEGEFHDLPKLDVKIEEQYSYQNIKSDPKNIAEFIMDKLAENYRAPRRNYFNDDENCVN